MNEIDVNKAVITIINVLILLGIPVMFGWHIAQAKRLLHKSEDWIVQILIIFVYGLAICAEIPALWARWIAYYSLNMKLPDSIYKLSSWDRWNHLIFYAALFLLTYTFTRKKAPKIVSDTLG
jgi:hypothetical protein